MRSPYSMLPLCLAALITLTVQGQPFALTPAGSKDEPRQLITKYCMDCHDASTKEGGLDLAALLNQQPFDGTLAFENLITRRMPPPDADQPSTTERDVLLQWLAQQSAQQPTASYRRISRHEFVHSLNDLLDVRLDITGEIPEDRGTNRFDSDRRIRLSREQLDAYFQAADDILEFALPKHGFPTEQSWTTRTIKDSHETYNIYVRPYNQGLLFSWTRANNGNSYSYFYDHFEPPVRGWYELTFDAAKVGDFPGDVSLLVYAGKYYYADDRPQPQRLLGVISLANQEIKSYTLEGFLHPGENVSVHCYSKHTWRQQGGEQGAYIERLQVRGPVLPTWPPNSMREIFAGLPIQAPARNTQKVEIATTALQRIGGSVTVSSFQVGMEKEKMLDRASQTFWHTRFTPDVAKPPHFVIVENPNYHPIAGLSYSTWTGGNGNGQVKAYSVSLSDDGKQWSQPVAQGKLEVMHAAEQEIYFPEKTNKRLIRFLITEAIELDGKSLASIGGLDVILDAPASASEPANSKLNIVVAAASEENLKRVLRRFAQRAFTTDVSDVELEPYFQVSLATYREQSHFLEATRAGLKSILCSHRFLLAPGVHSNPSYRTAADLARCLWLSVPDAKLMEIAKSDGLNTHTLPGEIQRMLEDPRAKRMIHSFSDQWLNLKGFNKVNPSLKLYPEYNELLNYYLPLETEEYLYHAIRNNLPVSRLIDSDFSILNQRLAEHYEIDGIVGQELRPVPLPKDSPRGGLLTMGSILKVTSDGFQTSPILRGAWISKNIAGNTLSPPPPNVKAIEPNSNKATSLKEQIEEHKQGTACYACHKSIDPYGFALENFDASGQWRTKYRTEVPHQGTFSYKREGYFEILGDIDASGEIGDSKFQDVRELKKILLSDHQKIAYNFARKFFEYTNGYEPSLKQRIDLYAMIEEQPEDCRLKDLITRIIIYSTLRSQP